MSAGNPPPDADDPTADRPPTPLRRPTRRLELAAAERSPLPGRRCRVAAVHYAGWARPRRTADHEVAANHWVAAHKGGTRAPPGGGLGVTAALGGIDGPTTHRRNNPVAAGSPHAGNHCGAIVGSWAPATKRRRHKPFAAHGVAASHPVCARLGPSRSAARARSKLAMWGASGPQPSRMTDECHALAMASVGTQSCCETCLGGASRHQPPPTNATRPCMRMSLWRRVGRTPPARIWANMGTIWFGCGRVPVRFGSDLDEHRRELARIWTSIGAAGPGFGRISERPGSALDEHRRDKTASGTTPSRGLRHTRPTPDCATEDRDEACTKDAWSWQEAWMHMPTHATHANVRSRRGSDL